MGQYMEPISKVAADASKEYQLEVALNRMEDAWKDVQFDVQPYKKSVSDCSSWSTLFDPKCAADCCLFSIDECCFGCCRARLW